MHKHSNEHTHTRARTHTRAHAREICLMVSFPLYELCNPKFFTRNKEFSVTSILTLSSIHRMTPNLVAATWFEIWLPKKCTFGRKSR